MCHFSTAIHKQLQIEKFYKYFELLSSETLEYHSYHSKNEWEKAKKRCIQKIYNTANKYITVSLKHENYVLTIYNNYKFTITGVLHTSIQSENNLSFHTSCLIRYFFMIL